MGHDMGFGSVDAVRAETADLLVAREPRATDRAAARAGAAAAREPAAEEGDLVLFTYPLLVDEGRQMEGAAELKRALEQPAFVEVHPDDAARLELSDGAPARLRTDAGEATVPVRVSEHIARGCVFVPWNNPGLAANTLLSGRTIVKVALAPVSAEATAKVSA